MAKIVCICGSMRFFPQMLRAADNLTLQGKIVLMPFVTKNNDNSVSDKLDLLHKRKIDLSEEIIVVSDESGYFGESTKSEIDYSIKHGKPVTYWLL